MYDMIKPNDKSFINMQSNTVLNKVYSKNGCVYHKNLFPEYIKIKKENLGILYPCSNKPRVKSFFGISN